MRWHDYTHRGRWTHSCLYDDDGNHIAQCFGQFRTDNCTRPHAVVWTTVADDHEEESHTRRAAKTAVRRHLREIAG